MNRNLAAKTKPLVLYLFCEGHTEHRYVEELVVKLGLSQTVRVMHPIIRSDPEHLLVETLRWLRENRKPLLHATRVEVRPWMICDDDGRPEAIQRFLASIKSRARDIQACRLEFAWMAPCFEVWPLLHLMKASEIPMRSSVAQRELSQRMPKYQHDRNATIECAGAILDLQTIHRAIMAASDWESTFGPFPECAGRASRYAGVYRLIRLLLSYLPDAGTRRGDLQAK